MKDSDAPPPAYSVTGPGYPSIYPPPAQYPAGMPYYPVQLATSKGLMYFRSGLILFVIIIALVMGINSIALLQDAYNDPYFLGSPVAFTLIISLVIIFLGAFISFIMGLAKFYRGRFELGPKHDSNVKKANIFVMLFFASIILNIIIPFSIIATGPPGYSYTSYLGGLFLTISYILQPLFFGLILIFFVLDLMPEGKKNVLTISFALFIAGPLILITTAIAPFMLIIAFVVMIIAIIGFIICYDSAYQIVRTQQPNILPMVPMPYYPYSSPYPMPIHPLPGEHPSMQSRSGLK
jgi:hypothetical protein